MALNELAKYFDHTLLKPYASKEEFAEFCTEAKKINPAMIAINSYPVSLCKELLKDTDIKVGAAISFPLGQTSIKSKVEETKNAIEDGADEIDYVINISKLKDKDYDYIKLEMESIVKLCRAHNVISKVIFENCYLTKDEIKKMSLIAKEVKPDFIKTSTGFGTSGALMEDLEIMINTVEGACQIKAAGGVRDLQTCMAMINLGVTRIGTSSSLKILKEFKETANEIADF